MAQSRCYLLAFLLLVAPDAVRAMRFDYYPAGPTGDAFIAATGIVRLGDEDRLRTALHAAPPNTRLAGLSLDSPGGDLEEGLRVGTAIHDAHLQTIVRNGAKCASACFIMFAAGSHLFADTSALVGVHSASYDGRDTPDAQVATVRMARRLSGYGVPDAILGKLVSAQPNQIWWLARSDLESMRVDTTLPPMATATQITPSRIEPEAPPNPPPPVPVSKPAQAVKPGFRVEPPAHGFKVLPLTIGVRVSRSG
jgi:hypothetical protein